jgi:hypothetical protein
MINKHMKETVEFIIEIIIGFAALVASIKLISNLNTPRIFRGRRRRRRDYLYHVHEEISEVRMTLSNSKSKSHAVKEAELLLRNIERNIEQNL